MNPITPLLQSAIVITLCSIPAKAAEFIFHESKVVIMDGDIVKGDSAKFYEVLHNNNINGVIVLQSSGGDVSEALIMAQMISTYRMVTAVSTQCHSACSFMFMSGVGDKLLTEDAIIGTHSPHIKIGKDIYDEKTESSTYWSLYGLMRAGGLSKEKALLFLNKTYTTPSDKVFVIDKSNAADYSIVVKYRNKTKEK